eukprot:g14800.t1
MERKKPDPAVDPAEERYYTRYSPPFPPFPSDFAPTPAAHRLGNYNRTAWELPDVVDRDGRGEEQEVRRMDDEEQEEQEVSFASMLKSVVRMSAAASIATSIRLFLDVLFIIFSEQSPHAVGVWFGHCSKKDRIEQCAFAGVCELVFAITASGLFVWHFHDREPTSYGHYDEEADDEEAGSSSCFKRMRRGLKRFRASWSLLISWPILIAALEWLPIGLVVSKASIFLDVWLLTVIPPAWSLKWKYLLGGGSFCLLLITSCSWINYRMLVSNHRATTGAGTAAPATSPRIVAAAGRADRERLGYELDDIYSASSRQATGSEVDRAARSTFGGGGQLQVRRDLNIPDSSIGLSLMPSSLAASLYNRATGGGAATATTDASNPPSSLLGGFHKWTDFVAFLFTYGFGWGVGFLCWTVVFTVFLSSSSASASTAAGREQVEDDDDLHGNKTFGVLATSLTDLTSSTTVRILILICVASCFYVRFGPEPVVPHESLLSANHGSIGSTSTPTAAAGSRTSSPAARFTRRKLRFTRSLLGFFVYTSIVVLVMAFSDPTYGLVHLFTKKLVEEETFAFSTRLLFSRSSSAAPGVLHQQPRALGASEVTSTAGAPEGDGASSTGTSAASEHAGVTTSSSTTVVPAGNIKASPSPGGSAEQAVGSGSAAGSSTEAPSIQLKDTDHVTTAAIRGAPKSGAVSSTSPVDEQNTSTTTGVPRTGSTAGGQSAIDATAGPPTAQPNAHDHSVAPGRGPSTLVHPTARPQLYTFPKLSARAFALFVLVTLGYTVGAVFVSFVLQKCCFPGINFGASSKYSRMLSDEWTAAPHRTSRLATLAILVYDVLRCVSAFSWSQVTVSLFSSLFVFRNNFLTLLLCFGYTLAVAFGVSYCMRRFLPATASERNSTETLRLDLETRSDARNELIFRAFSPRARESESGLRAVEESFFAQD